METYITTDFPENSSCESLLVGLLSFIHEDSFLFHWWYRLLNRADDNASRMRRMVGATRAAETPETSLSISIAITIEMNVRVRGATINFKQRQGQPLRQSIHC